MVRSRSLAQSLRVQIQLHSTCTNPQPLRQMALRLYVSNLQLNPYNTSYISIMYYRGLSAPHCNKQDRPHRQLCSYQDTCDMDNTLNGDL